jgi:hypothetical protein
MINMPRLSSAAAGPVRGNSSRAELANVDLGDIFAELAVRFSSKTRTPSA